MKKKKTEIRERAKYIKAVIVVVVVIIIMPRPSGRGIKQ